MSPRVLLSVHDRLLSLMHRPFFALRLIIACFLAISDLSFLTGMQLKRLKLIECTALTAASMRQIAESQVRPLPLPYPPYQPRALIPG